MLWLDTELREIPTGFATAGHSKIRQTIFCGHFCFCFECIIIYSR